IAIKVMGLTLNATIHVFVLLLLGGICVSSEGPNTWRFLGNCNGKKQSPINILTKKTISDDCLGQINFFGYEDRKRPQLLKNTGHYPEVEMKKGATISGPGLPATYSLKSFHFHWGTYNHRGSEHAIDGLHYAMELHIVHTKNNLTIEEARKDPDGIAVLAFFIKKSNEAPTINAWKTLADLMKAIPEKGDSVKLDGQFSLGGLLNMADLSSYYRYYGSLTTPNCNEAVIWTVYSEPIEVSPKTVSAINFFFEEKVMADRHKPSVLLIRSGDRFFENRSEEIHKFTLFHQHKRRQANAKELSSSATIEQQSSPAFQGKQICTPLSRTLLSPKEVLNQQVYVYLWVRAHMSSVVWQLIPSCCLDYPGKYYITSIPIQFQSCLSMFCIEDFLRPMEEGHLLQHGGCLLSLLFFLLVQKDYDYFPGNSKTTLLIHTVFNPLI
ncbi:hypothetical protein JD844_001294, partial [Phrynosoma platyrhinos]